MDYEHRVVAVDHETNWWTIGFKVGVGFIAAQCLFAIVAGSLWMLMAAYIVRAALTGLPASLPRAEAAPMIPIGYTTAIRQQIEGLAQRRLPFHVNARSSQECIAQTHQLINEEYQRCVRGYDVQVLVNN